jgi:hypothetical protein
VSRQQTSFVIASFRANFSINLEKLPSSPETLANYSENFEELPSVPKALDNFSVN